MPCESACIDNGQDDTDERVLAYEIEDQSDSDPRAGTYVERFPGYVARHYCVRLRPEHVGKDDDRSYVVEIQVVSVLVHAWAEVEHDILYKKKFRKASVHEKRILDCLNGLLRTGEGLLEQLHEVYLARVTSVK